MGDDWSDTWLMAGSDERKMNFNGRWAIGKFKKLSAKRIWYIIMYISLIYLTSTMFIKNINILIILICRFDIA